MFLGPTAGMLVSGLSSEELTEVVLTGPDH